LAHAEQATDPAAIVDGVRLVAKQFQDALGGQGVRRLDRAVGRAFDPSFHEAISQVETADAAPGTVAIELQAGYLLKDKLLRPALVIVARPPRKPAGAAPAADEEAARPAATAAGEETGEA
ncbi:MAG: nucleotide exchange factor GrpE, partial [Myxococcota bacterium]|nr:nucleotide exchange factor GrpE [Myxococcota bacterium]